MVLAANALLATIAETVLNFGPCFLKDRPDLDFCKANVLYDVMNRAVSVFIFIVLMQF